VASVVATMALVILVLAIRRDLTILKQGVFNERSGAETDLSYKVLSTHIVDAVMSTREMDTFTTIVTSCSGEIGEALLGEFLGHKWPHPIVIYTNSKCHQAVERGIKLLHSKADGTTAIVSERSDPFTIASKSASNVTEIQSSVELVHHTTLANPFQSQTFLWSDIDVMVALMRDGTGPLYRTHTILATYLNAVVYHRSLQPRRDRIYIPHGRRLGVPGPRFH